VFGLWRACGSVNLPAGRFLLVFDDRDDSHATIHKINVELARGLPD
jgi:hypothetical protein